MIELVLTLALALVIALFVAPILARHVSNYYEERGPK
jgi:hypothetical protein